MPPILLWLAMSAVMIGMTACALATMPVPDLATRCHFYRALLVDLDPATVEPPAIVQARAFVAAYCPPLAPMPRPEAGAP